LYISEINNSCAR